MNERLEVLFFGDGETDVTLGDNYRYTTIPVNMTVVAVYASPSVDDPDLTIDINDDGSGVITAVDASDKDVPGSWLSTHVGGTNTPVKIAADSVISLDANDAAASTRVGVWIWALIGEAN